MKKKLFIILVFICVIGKIFSQTADSILFYSNSSFQTTTNGASALVSDFIILPSFTLGNNFTIETWFKLESFSNTNFPRIFDFGVAGATKTTLAINPSGNLLFIYGNSAATANILPAVNIGIGSWNHYAVTVSGGNFVKVYVNGVVVYFSSVGFGTPVTTYTSNYLASQSDQSQAATIGCYSDFRIWTQTRTAAQISKSTLRIFVPSNSDSLYYYLPLNNSSNNTVTESITNFYLLAGSSTWVGGALNAFSRIQNNGAKYKYDSSRQYLSGTYKNALVANEKIQYSINGGTTWVNVDTALNNLWVVKMPTTFRAGVVKVRSAILGVATDRVFADFTIVAPPSALVYAASRIDVDEGSVNLINVSSINTGGGGTVGYSISSGAVTGISINAITGQLKADSIVPFGLYNVVVTASNIQGSTSATITINIKQTFKNRVVGFINNYFQTTSNSAGVSGDYINLPNFVLDSNFTVETWFKLEAGTGLIFPFIYNLGGWGAANLSQGLIMAAGISRTLDIMSWGVEANTAAPLDFTGYNLAAATWVHLAVVVKGRNTKVYVNGVLIKQYTNIGVPSNNNTFTNSRLGNGQSAGGTISTTLGKFQDFRVWKKARTALEIQTSYLTPVPISSDSLYYNILLNAPSIITTNNIINGTSINNVSTWAGAINTTSTVVSQGGTGAKYFYDTARQRLYGTISSALVLNEKIQYSINGGTTWTNVDTVFGVKWLVTLPITYKFATIKIRSSTDPTRVFQDYTFYSIPTISYSKSSEIDTFGTTGVSVVPTVSTSGITTCSITSGGVSGISINSSTGQISWTNVVPVGIYNLVISATNQSGVGTSNFTLNISSVLSNFAYSIDSVTALFGFAGNSVTPTITGGPVTYSFSNTTPAVSGITINSVTGVVSWLNSVPVGTYLFKVLASNLLKVDSSKRYKLIIKGSAPIISYSINNMVEDQNIADSSVSPTFNSTGLPLTFKILSGGGSGININSASGVINWTSKVNPGTYIIIVQANNIADSDQTTFNLTINRLTDTILYFNNSSFQSNTVSVGGGGDYIQLPTLDMSGNYTIETWFKNIGSLGEWKRIFDFGVLGGSPLGILVGFPTSTQIGYHANGPDVVLSLPSNFITSNGWNHIAFTFDGIFTSLYINGLLVDKQSTQSATAPGTCTSNFIGRSNWVIDGTTQGQYMHFKIWKKVKTGSEILATYRGAETRNSTGLHYYLPLDEKLFTSRDIENNTILTNYSTSAVALGAASTVISQNNGTGAKYFVDLAHQTLSGKYRDTLQLGETIQVSYDTGLTWRNVKYASNNNWNDSLTSVFNGGKIKVRSVIGGIPTSRNFSDFVQIIKPSAPIINSVTNVQSTKAIISFDSPLKNGGALVTNYIVVSNPSNITASGTSSPIEMSGLTNGVSYVFKMVGSNVAGLSDSSATSSTLTLPTSYSINTSVKNGSISAGPITVNIGDSIRITYTPTNNNYTVDSVIINNVLVNDSIIGYTFKNVIKNNTICVVYKLKTALISLNIGLNGTVSTLGDSIVDYGTKQKYTITPNTGYVLDSLFVNSIKVDSITSITFDSIVSNLTIKAVFKLKTFSIISSIGAGGTISPLGTSVVKYDSSIKYTITPNAGFVLDTLFVNGNKVDSTTSYTFDTVKVNKTIFAKFKVQTFTITATAGAGGSINPSGTNIVKYDSSIKYTITPNAGFVLDTLFVNGNKVDSTTSYTFDTVKVNKTIFAKFKVQTFTITATAGAGGSINPSGTNIVKYDSSIKYTITPNAGFVLDTLFVNGLKVDSISSYTFDTVTINKTIFAKFKVQTFTITSSAGTGGNINPSGTSIVKYDSSLKYTITPSTGFVLDTLFVNGNKVDSISSYTFDTVTINKTISAKFKVQTFTIISSAGTGGSISPSGTSFVKYDSSIKYTITPNAGFVLDTLFVNGNKVDSISSYTFDTVTINKTISAKFKVQTFTITATGGAGGAITPIGTSIVKYDSSIKYTITPNVGFVIDTLFVNGNKVDSISSYTFDSVRINKTISAKFKVQTFTITSSAGTGGSISPIGTSSVKYDSSLKYTITPNAGFVLDTLFVNGNKVDSISSYTFDTVTINKTIFAKFKVQTFTITATAGAGGSINPSGTSFVKYDSSIKYTITPNAGFVLDTLFVNGSKVDSISSYTFDTVRINKTISAKFKGQTFTITSSAGTGGMITPVGSSIVKYDSSLKYTITPNLGFVIDTLFVNGVKVDSISSYTFDTLKANKTISAKFKIQTFTITSSAGTGGMITPVGSSIVKYDSSIKYTITPNTGFVLDTLFVNGNKVDSISSYTFDTVTINKTISAKFKVQTFTITSSVGTGGMITPVGSSIVKYDSSLKYTITPNAGFVLDTLFVNGNKVDSISSYTFDTVTINKTISAKFKVQTFTITSSSGTGGMITPVGSSIVKYDSSLKYIITPNAGFVIDTLFVNSLPVDSISSYTFDTVTINKTIFAKFKVQTFTITSSAGTGGSISPIGTSSVKYDSSLKYTITPSAGFVLDTLFVNGNKVDSISSYTFDSVRINKTIFAKFKGQIFTITSSAGTGGSISPIGTSSVKYDSSLKYTITPSTGFVLDTLFVNGNKVDSTTSYTFDTVKVNKTIFAKFKVQTFTITATAGAGGSINPSGTNIVKYDSSIKYTITPSTGFVLDTLFVNGNKVDSISSYTFDTLKANKTISAKFKIQTFTITSSAGSGGSINPVGTSIVKYDSSIKYTITPDAGFLIDTIFVDSIPVDSISSYTFDSVRINKTISAKFKGQTFTITSSAGTGGSINPIGTSIVKYDSSLKYTITPNAGFVLDTLFVNGNKVDSITSYTFDSVRINKTIFAKFKVQSFTITSSAGTGGSISPSGTSFVKYDSSIKYTITPNAGFVLDTLFVNGNKVDSISSYTFDTVTINKTISAKFKVQTFTITSSVGTGGMITPVGSSIVKYDSSLKYTITPNAGFVLDTLFVNGNKVDSISSYTFDTVTINKTISAKFKVQTFMILSSAGTGGSINPVGTSIVKYDSSIKYTITPNVGFVIDTIFVDSIPVDSISSYTFDSVRINKTISAKFKVQTFTITASAETGGSINPIGTSIVKYDSSIKYTITPNAGFVLDTLFVNGNKVDSISSYTFDTVTINKTISAKFKIQTFTITATAGAGGSINPSGTNIVKYDSSIKYTITPNAGFVLDTLFVNGIKVDSISSYTFDSVRINKTISAKFKVQTFTITATGGAGGAITPIGTSFVKYDSSIKYTITPNLGFVLDTLFVNGNKVDSISSYTFDTVTINKTISAKFKVQTFTITATGGAGGMITPVGSSIVKYDSSLKYTITPNAGFVLDTLFVNGLKVDSISSYTFDSVKVNKIIFAKFKVITPPSKPLNVVAIAGNAQAIISFTSPIYNGGVAINKYIVEEVGGSIKDSNISSPVIINGLTNLQTYRFSVKAINIFGLVSDTSISNSIQPDNNFRFVKSRALNGVISADTTIALGGFRIIKYEPNIGFKLDSIYINDMYNSEITIDSINSYTFKNINGDSSIKVIFKLQTFTITSSAGTGGMITPVGSSIVKYDSSLKYTITPNAGFVLDTLFVNGNKVDSTTSYTFDSVRINKTIFAKFKVQTFTITATAGAGGSINPSGTNIVKYDSSIKYTITPNAGFVLDTLFVNGNKVDSISSYTFDTVRINKTIFAKFKVKTFAITATAGAGGSINPSGTNIVKYDSSIKYTITPNAGFVLDTLFVNGNKVDSTTSYTFDTVKVNKTIFAKFKVKTFTITATAGAGGSINPSGTNIVKYDSSIKYTITPNAGFVLDTLFVNGNKVDSTTSYTFDSVRINKTIFAKFKVQTFTITATGGAGGAITPIGTSIVKYDSSLKYTITPNAGFVLDTLFVNGNKVDSISSYTFDSVRINKIIFAKFKVKTFTITATAGAGGSINPSGTNIVKYDSSLNYTITPNLGFVLDTLFVNGNKVDSISSYTFDTVKVNKTIFAKFKVQTFTITATAGAGGSINPSGTNIVKYDSSIKYTITPNLGFVLDTLFVNGNKVDSISSYTFDTVTINKTISAKFKIQTFTITSSAGTGGMITPVGSSIVKYDSSLKYIITPNAGFVIDTLFVNSLPVDSISSYTFDSVRINKTIFAKFKVQTFTITSSAGTGGMITPVGSSIVKYDSSIKYTITPNAGFVLDTLFVNGLKVDSISSYTFDTVTINKTIFAKFKVQTFTITSTGGAGGMITPVGSSIVKYDSSIKYTITPNLGFVLDTLFVNGNNVDSISSYTFDTVTINKTISAKFKIKTFTITSSAGTGGMITPVGSSIVKYDSSIKYTITPNAGFVLDTLFVNGNKVDSTTSYTFDTVTINKTIFAKFKVQTFTITATGGAGGAITPIGTSIVKYDSSIKYTITPNAGFVLDTLFVNGNKVDSISSYTFDSVRINKIIFAKFKVKTFTITATAGAGGSINPSGTNIVKYDSSLNYTITPNLGFVLDTLFVNGNKVDSTTSYTFDTVKVNKTIFAKFKVQTFTITATAGAGGSINPSGTNIVKYDSSIKYTITPNAGFVLDTLFVNGNKVDSISSYTFDTVTINKTIFAKFKVQTFTITSSAGTGGMITPVGSSIVKYDSSIKYTITPNAGFVLDTLFVNGNKVDSISSYTFDTVTVNKTIFAKFKVQSFTITATGGAGGAITPIGTSSVKYDSSLKYTITPSTGFVLDTLFVNGNKVDSISSYTFDTVRINKTIFAKFKVQTFTITSSAGTGGMITPVGSSIVKYDSSLKYTITPNAGFVLDTLFVNGLKVDSISSYTFDTVTINKTIFAKFKVQTFTITATAGAGGNINPSGTNIVKYDSSLKYTITPNAGFVLDTLFVNGNKVDSISSYTFDTVTINKTIFAKFKVQTFTITATAGAGGSISPIGTRSVKYDSSLKYTITPNAGFVLDTLFVNGNKVDSISSYTFDTVKINKTILAKFKIQTFTITSSAGTGGMITPVGSSIVKYDSSLKYTITPNAGFVLDTLFVNGIKVDSISSYTFDTVTINKTIFAKFKVQTFTITATAGAGGNINPSGTNIVKYDSSIKYTITPNAGFVLDTLFVNGNKVDSISSYTFDTVTINKTIFAKFKVQTFTITATAGAGGSINPSGTSIVKYDSSLKYTITPNAGFVLDTLFVNGNKVDSISSYTFDSVRINKIIFAKFKVKTFTITATAGAGGSINPSGTNIVKYDSSLNYTITPNLGFVLDTLFVNGNKVDSTTSYTFDTVKVNKTIFAKFKVQTFTITSTGGAGGMITPVGSSIVKYDSSLKYTITPNAGFVLDTLFVNGLKVDSISSYTFDSVRINKTIFAKFKVQTFTITSSSGTGGMITPVGSSIVKYDSSLKYIITPNAGFVIDTLFVNSLPVDSISSYTFDSVRINKTIFAKFKVQTFTITSSAGTGGMITPVGSSIVKYDSSIKYTITPNAGFVLDTLFVNGNKVDSISSYTFDTVTINKTISAKFKVQTFTITATGGAGGAITPIGTSIVKYDSSIKYTITPNVGFVLDTLFVNGNKVDSISSYNFDTVTINKTIFAKFKVQTFTITATGGAGGAITPIGTSIVKYDSSLKYTITPNAGFVLDTLFVNGNKVDSISSYTFDTVKINKTILAKFKIQTFTITSSVGTGGMITPVGSSIVKYDSSIKYTITPNAGFVLDTLFVNSIPVDSISSYTFDSVRINKTIFAKFKVQTFTITSSAGAGGSISPSGTSFVKYDSSLKYIITPNAGFVLDTLFVNSIPVDSISSYTFDSVRINKTIFAKFKVQTFTITSSAGTGGMITPVGSSIVKYDSSIKYTITPNAGFVLDTLFVNGNKVDSISSYTFDTVTINKTIFAKFKVKTFAITATAGAGGMITPVGSSIVKYDSSLKYTITPNAGFVLDTLFVNGIKVDSISSYTFDSVRINKTITAIFKIKTFTITSSAGTGGMITPVGSNIAKYDSSLKYTITPNAGFVLDTLFVNGLKVDSISSYTFDTVTINKTIFAKFKGQTFTITASAGAGGSISPIGTSSVKYDSSLKYTITPDAGFVIDTIFVDSIPVDSISSYTFDSVRINKTIFAKFKVKTFAITATAGAGGMITPVGSSIVKYDSSLKYTITPNAGFVLDTLFVNGNKVDSISSYTFDTVTINKTIFAKFKVNTFAITATAGAGGNINPSGTSIVKYDSSLKYTITPSAGFVLDTLFVNGLKVDSISSYTFDTVRINKTISAKFKIQTFTITSSAGTGGSISPIGTSIVKYDSSLKYTITPNAGFVLDTLFVNGLKVDSISSYTFDTVTINKTIFAKFKLQTFTIISSAGTGGMITPVGSSIVKYDSSLKYTITPNAGFVLDTLFVNGLKVDSISSYTFDTVRINKTISAKFKGQTFTITSSAGTGGSISPIGTSSVKYDSSIKYTITPNVGFVIDTLFVNGLKVDSISSYTFDTVRINKTISAKFKGQTFTITSSAGTGGSISPIGTSSVKYDSSIKYTITPNVGFVIDTLFVNGVKVDSISSYTFDTVTINKTISAKFKVQTFTITATGGAGGVISPIGTSSVKYDSSLKYIISPNAGFVIDTLFVNSLPVDSISSYTFDSVRINKTISAKFKVQTFTITATGGAGGMITPVGSSIVKYDSSLKYTITPSTGFVLDTLFVNGNKVDSISNYTFDTLKANKTISAKFKIQTFTITSSAGTGGSISPIGTSSVKYDSSIKYTITPNVGFVLDTLFVNGNKVDSISSYTFDTVTINKTISAKFKIKTFTITSSAGTGGMITPVGSSIVKYDSSLKYTITPNTGFVLDTLFVNGNKVDSISSYTFDTVTINKTIFAKFKVQTFTITATAGAGGIINPSGTSSVMYDSSIKYTITPNAGFVLDTLFVNGNKVDSISSYTFDSVTINKTIFAKFKVQTFTITATGGAGGSISPSGTSFVKYDSSIKYTITPNLGFVIDTIFVNSLPGDSISSYTFNNVNSNNTIFAKFKVQTFTITASVGTGGSISPSGTSSVKYDSSIKYTITPNAGFVLDTLFVNGNKVDSISSYTFDTVTINKTIFAKFKVQTFTITATGGAGGSISPAGFSFVKYDSSIKYTITPSIGFALDTLFVDGIKVDSISSYTFDTLKANKTISAKFKIQTYTITSSAGTGGSISPAGTDFVNYYSSLLFIITPNFGFVLDTLFVNDTKVDSISSYTFNNVTSNQRIFAKFKVIYDCSISRITPFINRVDNALMTNPFTFTKHKWYLDGNLIDSTTYNDYLPSKPGVYSIVGLDTNGCLSNFSKKYYYSQSCIIPAGRLGNAATIQSNIVENINQIVIKWCTDIIKDDLTILIVDLNGSIINEQKIPANTGTYILNKSLITNNQFIVQVISSNGEIIQTSDIIFKTK